MNGIFTLYVDQYGNHFYASTVKELRAQIRGKCSKMYRDTKDGHILHIGYVIGDLWLTAYRPFEREVSL